MAANDDGMKILADGIVAQAVNDWKQLATGSKAVTSKCNFTELRKFFTSDWCDSLLINSSMTAEYILNYLEKYRILHEKMKEKRKVK